MLCNKFELLNKLSSVHNLDFLLKLTDDIFELIVNHCHSIAVLGMLDYLIGDRSSWMKRTIPVGKFIGVPTCVIAESKISAIGLDKATAPLSPTTKIL